jgi:hypothetical protein
MQHGEVGWSGNVLACTREVLGSNFGQYTDYPDYPDSGFRGYSSLSLEGYDGIVPKIRWLLLL